MKRAVLDTNILVSALLNSSGAPGRVLDLALAGELEIVFDDRVMAEWRDVLPREKFGFSRRDVETLLEFIEDEGVMVNSPVLGARLPDPDDLPFLEVAKQAEAVLITGNLKHYPPAQRCGVEVMDPATFLESLIS